MFKPLVLAAILCAPCIALAGQPRSLDDGFAVASNASTGQVETAISPMQDAGGTTDAMRMPGAGRGTDAVDTHAPADNAATHGAHPTHATTTDSASAHAHKGHGRAWQSLLPGAMK